MQGRASVNPNCTVHDDQIICLEDRRKVQITEAALAPHFDLTQKNTQPNGTFRPITNGRCGIRRSGKAAQSTRSFHPMSLA